MSALWLTGGVGVGSSGTSALTLAWCVRKPLLCAHKSLAIPIGVRPASPQSIPDGLYGHAPAIRHLSFCLCLCLHLVDEALSVSAPFMLSFFRGAQVTVL